MRKLTAAQKEILDRYLVFSVDDLPFGVFENLLEINDYETMWMDANRYLSDNWFEAAYNV